MTKVPRRKNTSDRYARVKALAEQSSFPHERETARKILAKMDAERAAESRHWADVVRAREAEAKAEAAKALEVLLSLKPGDKVEVIFEPRSSSSPNDKRTVTVSEVTFSGGRFHAYTSSGKVRPGAFAGGRISEERGGEVIFQPTIQQPVRRVLSLRRVNPRKRARRLNR